MENGGGAQTAPLDQNYTLIRAAQPDADRDDHLLFARVGAEETGCVLLAL
jgi:hypothetical protein